MSNLLSRVHELYPVACTNQYSGEIPAFSVVVITGSEMVNGQLCLQVDRPSSDWSEHLAITGPVAIANGGVGRCAVAGLVQAATSVSSPTDLSAMGPAVDSFQLSEHAPGFRHYGVVENTSGPKRVWVRFETITTLTGDLAGVLTATGTQTMDIDTGAGGSESDSGFNVTVRARTIPSGEQLASGTTGFATLCNGVWYFTSGDECSAAP